MSQSKKPGRPSDADTDDSNADTRSGRTVFDERGNAVWQWKDGTGEFSSDVDTSRVRAIQEATQEHLALSLGSEKAAAAQPGQGLDPYSSADKPKELPKAAGPRRTLSDMRKLSEEIVRARAAAADKTPPKK
ncbi:MAG TPA: hypothetical protein VGM84_24100 [Steroidobacteraceae bacterium]|jgi:hypothetical protein